MISLGLETTLSAVTPWARVLCLLPELKPGLFHVQGNHSIQKLQYSY